MAYKLENLDRMNALMTEIEVSVTESPWRERAYFAKAFGCTLRLDEPFGTACGAPYNTEIGEYSVQYFEGFGQHNLNAWENDNIAILHQRMKTAIYGFIQGLAYAQSRPS